MKFDEAAKASVRNIATHGDTDVFPLPFETLMFFDQEDAVRKILDDIHKDLPAALNARPLTTVQALAQVGYSGFRWATLIDPFWNAYYLTLVIQLAGQIEKQRLSVDEKIVFSYRFEWNEAAGRLFSDSTWLDYRRHAVALAKEHEFVVVTDVADFYPRIYHHRIENALLRLPTPGDTPARVLQLLTHFSKNVSYGLPVGGPASRVLSELALNDVDRHLVRRKHVFCRYADDYSLFCNSKADAYRLLVLLSEKLANEGLVLQKNKTRILSSKEFLESSALLDPDPSSHTTASEERKLLNISLRFDPYSSTAEDDYETVKEAVRKVDILGILGRELAKPAIDATVTKQAIAAIRALAGAAQEQAIRTLLAPESLIVLLPVFTIVLRAIRTLYKELSDPTKDFIDEALIQIYENRSHLLSLDLHRSYFVQAISQRRSTVKEQMLIELFEDSTNPLVRRLVIQAMANWECHYWLTDIKNNYATLTTWEKRAMILASYALGDEGKHWRGHVKHLWTDEDKQIREWFSARYNKQKGVPL